VELVSVSKDVAVSVGTQEEADASPIHLCVAHSLELDNGIGTRNLSPRVATRAFGVLANLAARTVGTDGVTKFVCPVCTLQKFPYINAILDVISEG
jgi:hypothetical protein